MNSLGLRTTIYSVPDLADAKEWYAKAFGFRPYFDEPYYVGFDIAGYELGLVVDHKDIKRGENVIAYWGVEDILETYDRLLEIGAITHEEPTNVGGKKYPKAVSGSKRNAAQAKSMEPLAKKRANKVKQQARKQKATKTYPKGQQGADRQKAMKNTTTAKLTGALKKKKYVPKKKRK